MSNPYIDEYGENTRFQPGVSGNPAGRPKGSKNKRTLVKKMIEDPNFDWSMLSPQKAKQLEAMYETTGAAIAHKMIAEAMGGNVRAAEWLRKTGYGK
ncbi:MAG TPA: DUF5681 domain-containing protein [Patescibacteria group bacterium]|nr:DUF5681 domain-containing protein [Patescibacteria group bacterium]